MFYGVLEFEKILQLELSFIFLIIRFRRFDLVGFGWCGFRSDEILFVFDEWDDTQKI